MLANLIHFILMPVFWIPAIIILGLLTYRNYKKINRLKVLNVDSVILMLEIPRTNDKKELAAEQMFASLHGILRDANELKNSGGVQEHLSFEIVSTGGQIRFYVWTPKILQSFVEGQIYAQYPTVQIHTVDEDYVEKAKSSHPVIHSAELGLSMNEALPIKTFDTFEVDPLAGITGTLAKLGTDENEELWIQILTRPVADSWHKETDKWINYIKSGAKNFKIFGIDWSWFVQAIQALWTPPAGGSTSDVKVELSDRAKTQITAAEDKATKLGYQVKIRLVYLGQNDINAKLNMQAIVGTFKQFNSTNLNGFRQIGGSFNKDDLESYRLRQFTDSGFILNISELASVYHLPHTSVETPNIVWATSKTAEPPAKLPLITGRAAEDENISAFGLTNFRGINHQFGMLRRDRSRHVYVIGQTGAGKSGLLELFALSDTFYNQGYCIIDPHGDFAIDNLRFVPANRINDVVYFNPADTQYPVAFNPLELSDAARKPNVCSEVIGVLKRMFGDSWGPRLEHILRYTLLALLDRPETTLLDISRMLTDKDFRKETLDYCTDVTVLQFWKHEFGQWNEKQVNESIAPVLNKVGAFTANPIIRNIIGQPKSSFNVRKIMDEGKILVVNLSKGLIGEDNAGILGAFLVTKIQLAAMSRSDIPDVEKRRPFYLYVDEFQNFATDSFAVILSEARKYGLNLTVANQYTAQMTDAVRDAVFGNVGTTISFRVSADDAPILSKQFEPTFEAQDLLQMNNRNFVISMIINGEKVPAFSATTLNIPKTPQDNFEAIVRSSREKYSRNRAEIEAEIRETIEQSEKYKKELSDSGRINPAEEQGTNWGSNYGVERTHVSGPKPTFITNSGKEVTVSSPADVKKSKLSPNAASGKQSAGLKDLKKILDEQKAEKAEKKREEQAQKKVLNPKDMPGVDSLPEAPKAQLEKTELVRAVDKKELSHIKEKAAAAEAPKSHEKILGNETEKNPFRNNERNSRRRKNRNKRKKNAPKTLQERLDAPQIDRAVNFASDLHDGRPGVATSQNVNPGAHQDTFRQNLRGNDDENNSGYLSIHH
ncbi:type IV secretory system conjugative DNA transfer family protein [Candidatus Saccharibacteria bacterium]|nr:type IV secretory system conjugative DNA transfer family protein [Candidatus Saccharibacteria bacterium]